MPRTTMTDREIADNARLLMATDPTLSRTERVEMRNLIWDAEQRIAATEKNEGCSLLLVAVLFVGGLFVRLLQAA